MTVSVGKPMAFFNLSVDCSGLTTLLSLLDWAYDASHLVRAINTNPWRLARVNASFWDWIPLTDTIVVIMITVIIIMTSMTERPRDAVANDLPSFFPNSVPLIGFFKR